MQFISGAALGTPQHWLLNLTTYLYVSDGGSANVMMEVNKTADKIIRFFNIVVF